VARNVIPLRGSEQERNTWGEAAALSNMAFSAWARRALNEAAESELAEKREVEEQRLTREGLKVRIAGGEWNPNTAWRNDDLTAFKPDPK
jgi:hypothetical protein